MKKKDSTKWIWYSVAIGVIILFLLMLLSSVLSVGERLANVNIYLSYGFYVIAFLLTYLLVFRPVMIILFSPTFSVETTLDPKSRKNYAVYKRVARRLIEQKDIPESAKKILREDIPNYDALKISLNYVLNEYVKKMMNKVIRNNAKTVMISTAISQNGRLDMLTVMAVNLKMIKELVEMCGFRPNMKNLSKLTINVFTTALIAEGLENVDFNDIFPQGSLGFLSDVPLIKPIMSSVTQGISNALLTLRIGIVTRKYLFSDAKEITKYEIRKGALLEAATILPSVIADGVSLLPKKLWSFFKKKPKENLEDEDDFW